MSTFLLHLFLKILPEINRVNESRINKGCLYIEKLSENSDLIGPQDKQAPYLRYSILCKKPALTYGLLNKLRSEKFEVGNYNWPQTLSKILKIKEPFETSEYISNNIINLPCYPSLHDDEINKITQIINNFTH
jgi:dTDP-4-amino-4,6-dideoxygalactose transaminase